MLFNLMGSLGLFLLGMWMLTEGLKIAGGHRLGVLLGHWTSNRKRGLVSGILITGLVQSSSAVTVATIGFVNAGLLKFKQAIWVVFGSNVGTTLTAWIVTLLGFSMNIEAATFPMIGVGAALRIFAPQERGKAFGMALAGFGLLFMGIDALQDSFSLHASRLDIESLLAEAKYKTLLTLGIGFMLTLLTQSSSAAIVIILTAVASSVIAVDSAAAAVIGANVGTTSTALIASIGATANAKRLAWAHVAFNGLTGVVALIMLPLFWAVTSGIGGMLGVEDNYTMMLAIFHSCFNIFGVLLIWPLEPRLSLWLLSRYRTAADRTRVSQYLDANAASVPEMAIRAMTLELEHLLKKATALRLPVSSTHVSQPNELQALRQRVNAVSEFISRSLKSELTEQQGNQFTLGLSVAHHLAYACMTYQYATEHLIDIQNSGYPVPGKLFDWFKTVNEYNEVSADISKEAIEEKLHVLTDHYKAVKTQLLTAAVSERINLESVDQALQAASIGRRFIEQIAQAGTAFQDLASGVRAANEPTSVPVLENSNAA